MSSIIEYRLTGTLGQKTASVTAICSPMGPSLDLWDAVTHAGQSSISGRQLAHRLSLHYGLSLDTCLDLASEIGTFVRSLQFSPPGLRLIQEMKLLIAADILPAADYLDL
jgi:hypothetical protein